MKLSKVLSLAILFTASAACSDDDDDQSIDTTPPQITAADGEDEIRPHRGEVRPASTDHLELRFQVSDPSGVEEVLVNIHSDFDQHSHGKNAGTGFESLSYQKVYQASGAESFTIHSDQDDVYWEGADSELTGDILAGPYHFELSATDTEGNQTSHGDNSSYVASVHIRRPYAPEVNVSNLDDGELDGGEGEALAVKGSVKKTGHSLASDLAFLWVRLYDGDDHDDDDDHDHDHEKRDGDDHYEKAWGSSQWVNESGASLPSKTELDFETILSGSNQIILPNEHGHYELSIWAEDTEGNITQHLIEVDVD